MLAILKKVIQLYYQNYIKKFQIYKNNEILIVLINAKSYVKVINKNFQPY